MKSIQREVEEIRGLISDVEALFKNPAADGNPPQEAYQLIDRKLRAIRATAEFLIDYNYSTSTRSRLSGANNETVTCHACGDTERVGVADLTSKGYLCEGCQEKFVNELNGEARS